MVFGLSADYQFISKYILHRTIISYIYYCRTVALELIIQRCLYIERTTLPAPCYLVCDPFYNQYLSGHLRLTASDADFAVKNPGTVAGLRIDASSWPAVPRSCRVGGGSQVFGTTDFVHETGG